MLFQSLVGGVAGIIAFSAYVIYIIAVLKGTTTPSRATWFIWSVLGIIIGLSYFFSGARTTIWVPLGEVLGPLVIAILAIKYGEGGWTKLDRFCIFGSAISLALWGISGSPIVGLLSSVTVDIIAAIPTIVKSYKRPDGEDKLAWTMTFVANFLNLFAIDRWVFAVLLYPIYSSIVDGTITALLYRRVRNTVRWLKNAVS